MAKVNLPKPTDSDLTGRSLSQYMGRLLDELEYVLQNLDDENLTESFRKKIKKGE